MGGESAQKIGRPPTNGLLQHKHCVAMQKIELSCISYDDIVIDNTAVRSGAEICVLYIQNSDFSKSSEFGKAGQTISFQYDSLLLL